MDERKELSLVCKRWLDVAFSYQFAKECPLTFEDCKFCNGTEPKSIFDNASSYRSFPCIQIGCFQKGNNLLEFYNTMQQIGRNTVHVSLAKWNPPPLILSCFPNLSQLDLLDIDLIEEFDGVPETLQTLNVKTAARGLRRSVYARIKAMNHLKYLFCEKVDLREVDTNGYTVGLFELSKDLDRFVQSYAIDKEVEVASNLLLDKEFDFCDITGLTLHKDFKEFGELLKFKSLKVKN